MTTKTPLEQLDHHNIRSLDGYIGEIIQTYLYGDIGKRECTSLIKGRLKEMQEILKGADKLLSILKTCPIKVVEE